MSDNNELYKKLINARLLKNTGSWIYCTGCNKTVGYLCYTTYQYFKLSFSCKCGERGSIEMGEDASRSETSDDKLILKKGRLCCPEDLSPLFSVVEKNLEKVEYSVVCKKCLSQFNAEKTIE